MLNTWIIFNDQSAISQPVLQFDTKEEAHKALLELADEILADEKHYLHHYNIKDCDVTIIDKNRSLLLKFKPKESNQKRIFRKTDPDIPYRAVHISYPEICEKTFNTLEELNHYFIKLNFKHSHKDYQKCIINIHYSETTNTYIVQYWDMYIYD